VHCDLAKHVIAIRNVQPSDKRGAVINTLRQLKSAQEVAAAAELVHLEQPIR